MDHLTEAQRIIGLLPNDTLGLASNQTVALAAIASALVSIAQSLDKIATDLMDNEHDALRVVSVE